jgi:ribose/xylose/arabinose/galactoside ABC-type transport system permease subunit
MMAKKLVLDVLRRGGIFWVFVLIVLILAVVEPNFINPANILNIVKQISINGILAIGMTFVILTGGIDLSVGSIMALSGVCAAYVAHRDAGFATIVPVLAGMAAGALAGFFNGIGIALGGFAPFIMTLATMISIRGLALVATRGRPIFNLSQPFCDIASGFTLGIPNLAYFLAACYVLGLFVLMKTVFGKRVYAIGGNEEAVRFSAIGYRRIKIYVYSISGLLSGLCGVLMASRITSGNATAAQGYELYAIAAVVIGGVSMSGGSGSLLGTLVGALIIGVIKNGLDIMGVSPYYQQIIQGMIIIAAIYLDTRTRRREA